MTSGHFVYIPLILLLGFAIGFVFGGRAARDAIAAKEQELIRRKAAREARAARSAAADPGPPPTS